MPLTCENLPSLTRLTWRPLRALDALQARNFLSFQDALHYLVAAGGLAGKTILVPGFYCHATLHDMEKHGLKVEMCKIDRAAFDVDLADFSARLQACRPEVVVIYNFFGKTSRLYRDISWMAHLPPDALLLSDFAHALIADHPITFLTSRHVYVDSARKTTGCMMAHLLAPPGFPHRPDLIAGGVRFRLALRLLFGARNLCFRLGTSLGVNALIRLGMLLYGWHDDRIGSRREAFRGYGVDAWVYAHIDFAAIARQREDLYPDYERALTPLAAAGFIELFAIPPAERRNICFFFLRIVAVEHVPALLTHMQDRGFWLDRLWDFDAVEGLDADEREWAKSVIVCPYTLATTPAHISSIAAAMGAFFRSPL
jgi:hypothetical protein